MFDGLRKAGMTLTIARKGRLDLPPAQDIQWLLLDVGASQAIIDGRIKMIQMATSIASSRGVRLNDGKVVELDTIVLATGYRNVQTTIERLFGPGVAEKVGPIGGIADDGEHRNMARPTVRPTLDALRRHHGRAQDERDSGPADHRATGRGCPHSGAGR